MILFNGGRATGGIGGAKSAMTQSFNCETALGAIVVLWHL